MSMYQLAMRQIIYHHREESLGDGFSIYYVQFADIFSSYMSLKFLNLVLLFFKFDHKSILAIPPSVEFYVGSG